MLRVNPLELNLGKDHGSRVWLERRMFYIQVSAAAEYS